MIWWDPEIMLTTDAAWTIAVGALTSLSCGLLGCYLILQKLSLIGDALSHAVLPGIVLGAMVAGHNPVVFLVGAMVFGILTAFLTKAFSQLGRVPTDSSMGVVFTSFFALGVVLITRYSDSVDLDPECVLYGLLDFTVLYTTDIWGYHVPRAFVILAIAFCMVTAFIGLLWKELKICSFDPALATTLGINATAMHYALMAMVAVVTVASFEAVGSILVIAMLILPGATAYLLTDRLWKMLFISAIVSILSSILGHYFAIVTNTNTPGMIVTSSGGIFFLVYIFAPQHGLLSRWVHNWALGIRVVREDLMGELWRHQVERKEGGILRHDLIALTTGGIFSRLAFLDLLWRKGFVTMESSKVALTEKGELSATKLIRSHRLWETFSSEKFGDENDDVHRSAHRLEHFISDDLTTRMDESLKSPQLDPQGKEIPRD